ncbi:MAG: hypothetical protein V4508_26370 [Pseudomonadota bacterium]
MAQSIQSLIAASVNGVLRQVYPKHYFSLCHTHAIVGANVISVVLNRVYRPVAGLAVIDCGGRFIELLDNGAFANPAGGAFHCWIESADHSVGEPDVVDLSFRNNHEYALSNGIPWSRALPAEYLWGPRSTVVVKAELDALPASFAEGQLWLRETDAGWDWMTRHLAENMNAYVALTAQALKEVQRRLPADSTLLAPAMPARPAALRGSAPANAPSLAY